jgi:hypothetical protein
MIVLAKSTIPADDGDFRADFMQMFFFCAPNNGRPCIDIFTQLPSKNNNVPTPPGDPQCAPKATHYVFLADFMSIRVMEAD